MVLASLGVTYAATCAEAKITATASSNDVSAADPHLPGHVLVRFSGGPSAADRAALERANDRSVVGHVSDLGVDVLRVPVGAEQRVVAVLQQSGNVQYAELE